MLCECFEMIPVVLRLRSVWRQCHRVGCCKRLNTVLPFHLRIEGKVKSHRSYVISYPKTLVFQRLMGVTEIRLMYVLQKGGGMFSSEVLYRCCGKKSNLQISLEMLRLPVKRNPHIPISCLAILLTRMLVLITM
jgi:hypothetical protein